MQRNSAEVINAIRQTGNTVAALNSLLVLTTSGVVAVSLLIGLILIDARIAFSAAGSVWHCQLCVGSHVEERTT